MYNLVFVLFVVCILVYIINFKKLCKKITFNYCFQILRITESYNPEISAHIIAEILNCIGKESIVVKILGKIIVSVILFFNVIFLEGADQCTVIPQGKFCVDIRHETEVRNDFLWSELIEPRLLFP